MKIRRIRSIVTGPARALLLYMTILVGASRLQAGEQPAGEQTAVQKQVSLGGKFSVVVTREEQIPSTTPAIQSVGPMGQQIYRFLFDNGVAKQEFDSAQVFGSSNMPTAGAGPMFSFYTAILREDGVFYLFQQREALFLGVAKLDKEGEIQPGHHQSVKESGYTLIKDAKFKASTGKVIDQFEVEDANRITKTYLFDSEGVPQLVSQMQSTRREETRIDLAENCSLRLIAITELPPPGSMKAASAEKSKASPPQGELKGRVIYQFLLKSGTQGEKELKQMIFPRSSSSAQSPAAEVELLDGIFTGGRVAFVYLSQRNAYIGVSELSASGLASTRDFPLPQNGEPLTRATFKYRSSSVIKGMNETADSTLILEYPSGLTKEYFINPEGKPVEKDQPSKNPTLKRQ